MQSSQSSGDQSIPPYQSLCLHARLNLIRSSFGESVTPLVDTGSHLPAQRGALHRPCIPHSWSASSVERRAPSTTTSEPVSIRQGRLNPYVAAIIHYIFSPVLFIRRRSSVAMGLGLCAWPPSAIDIPLYHYPLVSGGERAVNSRANQMFRPEIIRMSELNDSSELQTYSSAVLYVLSAVTPPPEYVEVIADNFINAIKSSTVRSAFFALSNTERILISHEVVVADSCECTSNPHCVLLPEPIEHVYRASLEAHGRSTRMFVR